MGKAGFGVQDLLAEHCLSLSQLYQGSVNTSGNLHHHAIHLETKNQTNKTNSICDKGRLPGSLDLELLCTSKITLFFLWLLLA